MRSFPHDNSTQLPNVRLRDFSERARCAGFVLPDLYGPYRRPVDGLSSALELRGRGKVLSLRVRLAPRNVALLKSGACRYDASAVRNTQASLGAETGAPLVRWLVAEHSPAVLAWFIHRRIISGLGTVPYAKAAEQKAMMPSLFDLDHVEEAA